MKKGVPWVQTSRATDARPAPEGGSERELQRIRATYHYYDTDASVRARRNPSNAGARAIGAELETALRNVVGTLGFPEGGAVCDVGCGRGKMLAVIGSALLPRFPRLYGIDILPDRIQAARRQVPNAQLWVQSGETLPFADNSIDLLVVATVFSSILDSALSKRVAAEMWRVRAEGGTIIGYDFRYPNPMNPHTRRMGRSHWRHLFPEASIETTSIILLPQLARRLHRFTDVLYPKLRSVPVLRTHYLVKISSPQMVRLAA